MNGLDSTTMIKAHAMSVGQSVVVVGVTGNGLESDIAAFTEAGADLVMIKPLNLSLFLEFLSQRNILHS